MVIISLIVVVLSFSLVLTFLKVKKCEEKIEDLERCLNKKGPPPSLMTTTSTNASEVNEKQETLPSLVLNASESKTSIRKEAFARKGKNQTKLKKNQIIRMFRENWLGFFGSLALVLGAVFFSLTSKIMQRPEARVFMLYLFSTLLLVLSFRKKDISKWKATCGCLRVVAGTIILFASLGSGWVAGLCFIQSRFLALLFLLIGASINMVLSKTTPFQTVASFHIVLNVLAFCFLPSSFGVYLLTTLVVLMGLINIRTHKWDLHNLIALMAFAAYNVFLFQFSGLKLLVWQRLVVVMLSIIVAGYIALSHYTKKYQSSQLELLPFFSHTFNWGVLALNIYLHAPHFKWISFILMTLAGCGFILANVARKKEILWLYHTDSLISQSVAMLSVLSLYFIGLTTLDILILLLVEVLFFCSIFQKMKQNILIKTGYMILMTVYVVIGIFSTALLISPNISHLFLSLRMLIVAGLSWLAYQYLLFNKIPADDLGQLFNPSTESEKKTSVTASFGIFFFVYGASIGHSCMIIQMSCLIAAAIIPLWKKYYKTNSLDIVNMGVIISLHILSWILLLTKEAAFFSNIYFLGILVLDLYLIFFKLFEFKSFKEDYHMYLVYFLGLHILLLTSIFIGKFSLLVPIFFFLAYSLLFLELSRLKLTKFGHNKKSIQGIKEGMIHIGILFLVVFSYEFFTLHAQTYSVMGNLSLRWVLEVLGIGTIIYWIKFSPNLTQSYKFTKVLHACLIELCLVFGSFCVFLESSEILRPVVWAILSICLLKGSLGETRAKRIHIYSWLYLMASIINVAFVTKSLSMHRIFDFERGYFCVCISILLQIVYAFYYFINNVKIAQFQTNGKLHKVYRFAKDFDLTVFLPILIGLLAFFFFNFERAILTLIWVGLLSLFLIIGLVIRSKRSVAISMILLFTCVVRLLLFDLRQIDRGLRAWVFFGVGAFVIIAHLAYKKYKHRIEIDEIVKN